MQKLIKRYLTGIGFLLVVLLMATFVQKIPNLNIGIQSATVMEVVNSSIAANNGTKPVSGYAWNDNIGWINFGTTTSNEEGRAYLSNSKMYGYAWGENVGWISLNCANTEGESCTSYGVTQNNSNGTLTGYAWGENIGWINFAPVGGGVIVTTSNTGTNTFSGYAWGENVGWISFSGTAQDASTYGVDTTWVRHSGSNNPPVTTITCNYIYSAWTICADNKQTRTAIPDPSECTNTPDEELSKICTLDPLTATTTIGISLSTTNVTMFVGEKIEFKATVTGTTTNNDVNWTVVPIETIVNDFYGTISADGVYTAPEQAVNVTIVAKAKADPLKMATANVIVKLIPPNTPVRIFLSPASTTIFTNETVKFIADVISSTTKEVSWIIVPIETIIDDFYGTISADGVYTAPDHAVNITIIARAMADITKSAEAKIIVRLRTQTPTSTPFEILPEVKEGEKPLVTNNTEGNSSSRGGGNLPAALDVSKLISDNISVLGTTTKEIYLEVQRVVSSPVGSAVTNTITTVGVVGGGVAATSVIVLNGTTVTDLLFLPFRLWGLLLSALGLKKRNHPWGTVYDSVTKQPLDPAYVTLKKIGSKEENTSITDLDGRYGFLVTPGQYILTANKTNYIFPSKKLAGKNADALYQDLYFGEKLDIVKAGALLNKNIPLDPLNFDWNEFAKGQKKIMKFYSRREKLVRIITDWLFRLGFIVSVVSLFLVTAPYNLIIFGLYLVLAALRKYGLGQRALGALTEKNGDPLSFAIIRVFAPDLDIEITNKVASKIGRYYCLVPKGKYYVKIEKKNNDESYTTILTSKPFEAENGIINKNFVI